jgi:hypothetical protein
VKKTSALLFPLLAGCYTYAPVEPAAAPAGVEVRARISASAAERIANLVSLADRRILIGKLVENVDGTMTMEVPSVTPMRAAGAVETLHQRVSLARSEVVELETRRLDRTRTGALVAVGIAAVAATVAKALQGEPAVERGPRDGGTDNRRWMARIRVF